MPTRGHERLIAFLHRRARKSCPFLLRNQAADVAQECSMRLLGKVDVVRKELDSCIAELSAKGPDGAVEAAKRLARCLRSLEEWGHRRRGLGLRKSLERCRQALLERGCEIRIERILKKLRSCSQTLGNRDGMDLFTEAYCHKNLYWAFSDARRSDKTSRQDVLDQETERRLREKGQLIGDGPASRLDQPEAALIEDLDFDRAIRKLSPEHQEVIKLFLLGLNIREMSEMLEINPRRAESRFRRAKKKLRRLLNEEHD